MKIHIAFLISCFLFSSGFARAQEKTATMKISLEKVDTNHVCKVVVVSEDKPVAGIAVKLYVERLFGLLEVGGEVTTDESGVASFDFPNNIPLNSNGQLVVVAKVEDDDNYGSFEAKTITTIGVHPNMLQFDKKERSLSASRDRAPIYFIVASIAIISGIWGTLLYVITLVFKIKKLAKIKQHQ